MYVKLELYKGGQMPTMLSSFLVRTKSAKMQILTVTTVVAILLFSIVNAFDNASDSSTDLVCPSTHFGCKNAYKCIQKQYMCNGKDGCLDGSDEDLTTCILQGNIPARLTCASNEFQCKNGFKCVRAGYLCDNDNDCGDNSDEDPNECIRAGLYDDHVTCADIGFMCGGGTGPCIGLKLLCNGKNDCGDNTDEDVTNCRSEGIVKDELSCAANQFRCKNEFKCIWKTFLCDHDNDCFDGSDEDPVECAKEGLVPDGTTCADLGFECRNTTFDGSFCIGNLLICDGKDNCGDNSDENPEICEHRSDRPTLEILPWYEPPEANPMVVRLCGNDQFRCDSKCISKKDLCNSNVDCSDGSDEDSVLCLNRTRAHKCMSHQFKCKNNKCIYKGHICDGDDDCGDLSDEDSKTCGSRVPTTTTRTVSRTSQSPSSPKRPIICKRDQFKCLDGSKCIRNSSVCDRQRHCDDGSDERQEACTRMGATLTRAASTPIPGLCEHGQFQCNNKRCILESYVCDGDNDCQDYTDESPPHCNRISTRQGSVNTAPPPQLSCLDGQFRCSTHSFTLTCIPRAQVCDGTRNCPLGDDEYSNLCQRSRSTIPTTTRHTTVGSCAEGEFLCTDHQKCIPIAFACDESRDCDNGSDEDPTICLTSSSQRPSVKDPGEDTYKFTDDHLYVVSLSAAALVFIAAVVFVVVKKYRSSQRRQRRF